MIYMVYKLKEEPQSLVDQANTVGEVWNRALNARSPHTAALYRFYLDKFLKRWELTCQSLFEIRQSDLEGGPLNKKRVEKYVITLNREMASLPKGGSPSSQGFIVKAVNAFFSEFGEEYKLRMSRSEKPKHSYIGKKRAKQDEIREIWSRIGGEYRERNRALLMFLKDSGLRVSDIVRLNYGDYVQAVENLNVANECFKAFKAMRTQKTGVPVYINIGPETIADLEVYLKERQKQKEELKPDSPLFSSRGRRMNSNNVSGIFKRLGLEIQNGPRNISAHSLRKFHYTALSGSDMAPKCIDILHGKGRDPYYQPDPEDITKQYMENYDVLRVNQKPDKQILELKDLQKQEAEASQKRIRELEDQVQGLSMAMVQMQRAMQQLTRSIPEKKG